MKIVQRGLLALGVVAVLVIAPLLAQAGRGRTGDTGQGERGQTERENSVANREPIRPVQGTSRPAPSPTTQVPPLTTTLGSASGQQSPTQVVNAVTTAVEEGGFVEADGGFTLKAPVDLTTSPDSKTVEFQVGTIDGKPAYLPLELPRDASENQFKSIVSKIDFKIPGLQACAIDTDMVCVETRDGECVRYECVRKK